MLLMALLVVAIVGCGATKHQINTYEECMSRCNLELEHCVLTSKAGRKFCRGLDCHAANVSSQAR